MHSESLNGLVDLDQWLHASRTTSCNKLKELAIEAFVAGNANINLNNSITWEICAFSYVFIYLTTPSNDGKSLTFVDLATCSGKLFKFLRKLLSLEFWVIVENGFKLTRVTFVFSTLQ